MVGVRLEKGGNYWSHTILCDLTKSHNKTIKSVQVCKVVGKYSSAFMRVPESWWWGHDFPGAVITDQERETITD